MISKFITWLKKQVGSIYVWGGQGEVAFNEAWIKKMEPTDKNADRAIAFYRKQLAAGVDPLAAYDCSGLIVRFLLDNDIIHSDMTAAGLFSLGKEVKKKDLSPGDFVSRHNGSKIHHIGVYIGDDMVIHAKGRDVGVVKEHIDVNGDDYWNRFCRLSELSKAEKIHFPRLMVYSGSTYVNLRNTASAASLSAVIDKVSKGEEVLVLSMDDNGWADVVKYCDDDTYKRGFCISKYFRDAA